MSLRDEIFEQPEALRRLLEIQAQPVRQVAARIRDKDPSFVYLAARGTSDNAGLYAKYLWGISNGLPVALAAPSMFSSLAILVNSLIFSSLSSTIFICHLPLFEMLEISALFIPPHHKRRNCPPKAILSDLYQRIRSLTRHLQCICIID